MRLDWLPNAVSLTRIALIAPIVMLMVAGRYGWALALFVLASLSDGIDGWLAKRFAWHSRLGAFLDPAGDKLLVAWAFGTLAWLGHLPVWLAVMVILRDVLIVTGSILYHTWVRPLAGEPTRISKLNTALEFLLPVFVLSRAGYGWPEPVTITMLGAAVLVTVVISGYDYLATWIRDTVEARA